ncbi:MAG: Fic family protein [Bacteroidota bacterium]
MTYNWEQEDWPNFQYDLSGQEEFLLQFAENQGRIISSLHSLPDAVKESSILDVMVAEALKTSAIEGEFLSREDVLSSIRNILGINRFPEKIKDKRAEGVAKLMVAVREGYKEELSEEILFEWHQMVMEPYANIRVGKWRTGEEPIQIVSGPVDKVTIHFEAPPSARVPSEMKQFIQWFNETAPGKSKSFLYAPVRSAIAHLYFESIHPFEDGNGRIGRALSEKVLSQSLGRPTLMSFSNVVEPRRKAYYEALKTAQRATDITAWIIYFLETMISAQNWTIDQMRFSIKKIQFFDRYKEQLNFRQEKVLSKMFEAGPLGFEGGMRTRKYISITKTSKATATRDLKELVRIGALTTRGGGRSTRYNLNLP